MARMLTERANGARQGAERRHRLSRDNRAMHLVLSHASALSPAAAQAASTLQLPHLERLLARLGTAEHDRGDELSLSPPHERALAAARGWALADGLLPFAADQARADGLAVQPGDEGWGLLSPGHWHVGTDQVSMTDPATLELDEAGSRIYFAALAPLFADDGWALHWGAPSRWYASHPTLRELPTASLDRVVGRNVDLWLTTHPAARLLRRLQAEAQMLLYNHPANDAREARGLRPVNSFWLSGTGPTPDLSATPDPTLQHDDRLRAPALAEDWTAWAEAWAALDAGPLRALLDRAETGEPVTLTLCGERHALRLTPAPRAWWQRGWLAPGRKNPAPLLASL